MQQQVVKACCKAHLLQKRLYALEETENDVYQRELASIKETEQMHLEETIVAGPSTSSVPNPLLNSKVPLDPNVLEFPDLGKQESYAIQCSLSVQGQTVGFLSASQPNLLLLFSEAS